MTDYNYSVYSTFGDAGVQVQQLAAEINNAWGGAITFTLFADVAGARTPSLVRSGFLYLSTVETPDSAQESALSAAITAHSPVIPIPWQLTILQPHAPVVGQIVYFSNISREGSGSGALAWWDGSQWLRASDNAVATVPA